jgi:RecB family exonuclease
MAAVNGQSASYGFLDRVALLFGGGRLEQIFAERAAGGTGVALPPVVAPGPATPEPQLNLDVAEVVSPSQVNTYLDCAAKWFFKHFRGLPDVKDAKRALGKAVHKALETNFRQKIETKKDLGREQLLEIYALAWKEEATEARFAEDDDRAELERTGAVLVQKYLVEAAPEIIPIAVEHPVSGEIASVKVRGYLDLMDSNGRIVDLKTSSKKPSEIMPDYRRQVATYAQLMPGASGKVAIHTLVRTKTPQLIQQNHQVTPEDIRHTQIMYPLAQEGMRSGLYAPNRNSLFCSRKSCAFWQACQQEFGGEVAES